MKMNSQEYFGFKLAYLRTTLGYTQEEFAKMLNISTTTLHNYEKGILPPDSELMIKLANVFRDSIDTALEKYLADKRNFENLLSGGVKISNKERKSINERFLKEFNAD